MSETVYRDPTPVGTEEQELKDVRVSPLTAKYTKFIREKEMGVDVRESVARGIEAIEVDTNTRVKNIKKEVVPEITQNVIKEVGKENANAEVLASRFDDIDKVQYESLSDRLNSMTEESTLNSNELENAKNSDLSGEHNNINGRMNAIESNLFATRNIENTSKYFNKLDRENSRVQIVCQGTSMTLGTGSTEGADYPKNLYWMLTKGGRNGQTYSVINHGYGGDTAKMSYERWSVNPDSDLLVLELGTNDFNKSIEIDEFTKYVELCILKGIKSGCGIVLTTPHKWREDDRLTKNGFSLSTYVSIVKLMAQKYACIVIDINAESRNIGTEFYTGITGGGIHFNNAGYLFMANKIYAGIGFQHPCTIPGTTNSSFLSVRGSTDGLRNPKDFSYIDVSPASPAPEEEPDASGVPGGIGIHAGSDAKVVYYTIKTTQDNLAIIPNFLFRDTDGSESIKITVDSGASVQQYSNIYQYQKLDKEKRPYPSTGMELHYKDFEGYAMKDTYNIITQSFFADALKPFYYRVLPIAGYHTVRVEFKKCRFYGFDFINVAEMKEKVYVAGLRKRVAELEKDKGVFDYIDD